MASIRHESLDREDREDAPFLDSPDPSNPGPAHRHIHGKPSIGSRPVEANASASAISFRLKATLFAMVLAVEIGFAFLEGPMVRIMESIACRQYFLGVDPTKIGADGQVPEAMCKIGEVQAELAAVKGYHMFFDGSLSALLAIPYGLLADRRGRKSTLALSLPGFALNSILTITILWFSDIFPLRALWFTALTWVFGGGPVVSFAIIWTMMADVTSEAERAGIFFQFAIVSMGADFASSALSSYLMTLDPWIPLVIGFAIVMAGMMLILALPETKHALPPRKAEPTHVELSDLTDDPERKHSLHNLNEPEPYRTEPDMNGDHENEPPSWSIQSYSHQSILAKFRANYRFYLRPYRFILNRKPVLLLLTAFLVYRLSRGSSWFLTQYISTRYSWTLAQSNFLVSARPTVSIPLFLFGLPFLKSRVLNPRLSSTEKDLWLARRSIFCLTVGTLGIGLSPTIATLIPSMIVQTSGSGFVFLARSIITTLVERDETARLFTAIEIIQSLGNVVASLSITTVFQIGLRLGGFWIGLAWMMTSTLFCLVGVAIWSFNLPPSPPTSDFVVEDYDGDDRA
ncbi:Major facilitator superfamily domain, general substrate transporter [Penicillium expansum]|uniref:Major facilitator superfamily domain, general substrate transporter n=1 Tax=Penicillium expansum TaxID=27334 RepID=A0A0A2I834_PENEN|nr:Major facilitator superfamily domain, general substrate transporter [Penicillium expansum]KGO39242.1 Major facilitator superfamily domain, general substrate transporter [Penicillium expansum]KGO40710.1 Major facilitator superfamily domain, general substrate transporter [Penicillium expansum]KGO54898.1 Major facilitator superfamily domain, general substrate transporter [Penicillium expansum]